MLPESELMESVSLPNQLQLRTVLSLKHFDSRLEGFFEMGNVGHGKNAGKVWGDGINGGNQAIAAFCILSAKTFIDNQHLQGCA